MKDLFRGYFPGATALVCAIAVFVALISEVENDMVDRAPIARASP